MRDTVPPKFNKWQLVVLINSPHRIGSGVPAKHRDIYVISDIREKDKNYKLHPDINWEYCLEDGRHSFWTYEHNLMSKEEYLALALSQS